MATRSRAPFVLLSVLPLLACGLPFGGGSEGADGGREVTAQSGSFSITVPDGYADVDISTQPATIEVATQRGDLDQIIVSRHQGADTSDTEALSSVVTSTTSHGLRCEPLADPLGGSKAWSCTGNQGGVDAEKVFATVKGDGQSLVLLVQGEQGAPQDLARDLISSVDWR